METETEGKFERVFRGVTHPLRGRTVTVENVLSRSVRRPMDTQSSVLSILVQTPFITSEVFITEFVLLVKRESLIFETNKERVLLVKRERAGPDVSAKSCSSLGVRV